MSFPNIIYGDYGNERVAQSTTIGNLPLGTKMILPDGREFRHTVCATAAVAGKLYQGDTVASGTGNVKSLAVVTAIAGAYTCVITMSATGGISANQYDDGYLFSAASTGTGSGYAYKIKTASTAAAASTTTVTLWEPIKVTLSAATTTVGLRVNEYKNPILATADTVGVNSIVGVAPGAISAGYYGWLQTKGPAAVFTDNTTLVVGMPAVPSTTVAGAFACPVLTGTAVATVSNLKQGIPVGWVMSVAASAEYSLVNLNIN